MTGFLTASWIAAFRASCDCDPELRAIAGSSQFRMLLRADDQGYLLVFDGGIRELRPELPVNDTWDFALEADGATWDRFLAASPPRHHHDVLAMWMRVPDFRVEGDRRLFMASARVVRR